MSFALPSMTPVVKRICIINLVVFGVQLLLGFGGGAARELFTSAFAISPALWKEWFPLLPVWQLLCYGFLHSYGDIFHIIMNLLMLYFLGTMVEALVGGRRFLVFYLLAVVIAGFAQLMLGLAMGSDAMILGASGGAIAAVIAAATLRPQTRIIFIIFPITLKTLAIILVGVDLYYQILELQGVGGGVARLAHLAGAAFGFLSVRQGWIYADPLESYERWRSRTAARREESVRERVDELLAKINREGIQSLSRSEQAFLKKASKRR